MSSGSCAWLEHVGQVGQGSFSDPAWSPDGRFIVGQGFAAGSYALVLRTLGGQTIVVRRTPGSRSALDPDWQPVCTVRGGPEDDVLVGTRRNETICGFEGDDVIRAGGGDDVVLGGDGDDLVIGGAGADRLFGARGNDRLEARDGDQDVVDGGPGRDAARTDRRDVVRAVRRR